MTIDKFNFAGKKAIVRVDFNVPLNEEGKITVTKQKTNPQIYHHKWNFVKDDYPFFNVCESIERSIQWKSIIGSNKEISSKIGTLNYWIDLLHKNNIPLENHTKKPKI